MYATKNIGKDFHILISYNIDVYFQTTDDWLSDSWSNRLKVAIQYVVYSIQYLYKLVPVFKVPPKYAVSPWKQFMLNVLQVGGNKHAVLIWTYFLIKSVVNTNLLWQQYDSHV